MAQQDAPASDFDRVRFVHHSIPHIDVAQVNLSTHTSNFKLDYPLYINAMTGGSEWTKQINENWLLWHGKLALPWLWDRHTLHCETLI